MNIKIKKDFAVSIFFAILAIAYLYSAQSISVFSPFGQEGPDSKTVPNIIGGLMLLLSLSLFISTLVKYHKSKVAETTVESAVKNKGKFPIKLVISLILLSAYIASYNDVGFIISSIVYMVLQSIVLTPADKRKKWTLFIIVLSVVFTVAIYWVFSKYLTLVLPAGIFGF